LKLAYTAFMCVLVPFYWDTYGPTNFLYFCDVALFLTLGAVWLENPLLAGMPAVGILLPQMLWVLELLAGLFGLEITEMTGYMFDENIPLFSRGLSTFHGWLPFLLLVLVFRLGYDVRSFRRWTVLAWGLMLISYFLLPAPPAPVDDPYLAVNVNYVYGLSEKAVQEWMAPDLYFGLMMVLFPLVLFWPSHLFLKRFAPLAR
jgi:hypothetical protein